MKLVTMGYHINLDAELYITNQPMFPKPNGGIWASPLEIHSDGTLSEWHEFSNENNIRPYNKGAKYTTFELKKDAKVLMLQKVEDSLILNNYVQEQSETFPSFSMCYVDWERVAAEYDAVIISRAVITFSQHYSKLKGIDKSPSLYGWDVASALIFNINAIEPTSVEYKTL